MSNSRLYTKEGVIEEATAALSLYREAEGGCAIAESADSLANALEKAMGLIADFRPDKTFVLVSRFNSSLGQPNAFTDKADALNQLRSEYEEWCKNQSVQDSSIEDDHAIVYSGKDEVEWEITEVAIR